MRRLREEAEGGSLSFLDVIACAFGAVILLVLVLPVGDFGPEEETSSAAQYGRLLFALGSLEEEGAALARQLAENGELAKRLDADLAQAEDAGRYLEMLIADTREQSRRARQRAAAIAESSRILRERPPEPQEALDLETELAGIPVDSEYVAFVVDTSGSMEDIGEDVMEEVANVLSLYPKLRGFQILNDQGRYLYPAKRRRWIPDSPARRRSAIDRMQGFWGHSASNPADGILTALHDLYDKEKKMAIFVFGDDYLDSGFHSILLEDGPQGADFDGFLGRVERGVRSQGAGAGTLRIHAIGFSNICNAAAPLNFSVLMRELTRRYQGAFLALPQQDMGCRREQLIIDRENGLPVARPRWFG